MHVTFILLLLNYFLHKYIHISRLYPLCAVLDWLDSLTYSPYRKRRAPLTFIPTFPSSKPTGISVNGHTLKPVSSLTDRTQWLYGPVLRFQFSAPAFGLPSDGHIMRVARPHIWHSNYIIFRVYFEGIKFTANGQILYYGANMIDCIKTDITK